MMANMSRQGQLWAALVLILLAATLVVTLAPQEQTLGPGIRIVYVHVGLVWAGMAGLALAGILGLLQAITAHPALEPWLHRAGRVGFALYAAGFVASIFAQQVNWGGLLWQEPRLVMTLNVLAGSIIVLVAGSLLPTPRLRGAVHLLLLALLLWSGRLQAPQAFHPQDPISTSPSPFIRLTFAILFLLCLLLGGWIIAFWRAKEMTGLWRLLFSHGFTQIFTKNRQKNL